MYKLTIAAAVVASASAINTVAKTEDIADRDVSKLAPLVTAEVPTQEQIDRAINYFGNDENCVDLFNQLIRIRTDINTKIDEYKVISTRYEKECACDGPDCCGLTTPGSWCPALQKCTDAEECCNGNGNNYCTHNTDDVADDECLLPGVPCCDAPLQTCKDDGLHFACQVECCAEPTEFCPSSNSCLEPYACCTVNPSKHTCKGTLYGETLDCLDAHHGEDNVEDTYPECCDTDNGFAFCDSLGQCATQEVCCNSNPEKKWCDERKQCLSNDDKTFCEECQGETYCVGQCVTNPDYCCPDEQHYVQETDSCEWDQCPAGEQRCSNDNKCRTCCNGQVDCNGVCVEPDTVCCPIGTDVCGNGCIPTGLVCCEGGVPSDLNGQCPCPAGENRCADGTCSSCCEPNETCPFLNGACVAPQECCVADQGNVWCETEPTVFNCESKENCCKIHDSDFNQLTGSCCPVDTKFFVSFPTEDGTNEFTGCCDNTDEHACCPEGYHIDFTKNSNVCVKECPCEGCCDYNCCDELDYFLHKAFEEMYSSDYNGNFNAFYNDWFNDFYTWWYNGDLKH